MKMSPGRISPPGRPGPYLASKDFIKPIIEAMCMGERMVWAIKRPFASAMAVEWSLRSLMLVE